MKNLLFTPFIFLILFIKDCISQNIWEPTNGPRGADITDAIFASDGSIAISVWSDGIYISNNKGIDWQRIFKGIIGSEYDASDLAGGKDGKIYANIGQELYSLNHGSDEWIKMNYTIPWGNNLISTITGYLYLLEGFTPTVFSSDDGQSFQKITALDIFESIDRIDFNGNGNNFIYAKEKNIYSLYRIDDDCMVLNKIADSIASLYDLFWHPSGYLFYIDGDLIRMDRNGNSQTRIDLPFLISKGFMVKPNGTILAMAYDGDYESSDWGVSWFKVSSEFYNTVGYGFKFYFEGNDVYLHNLGTFCQYGTFRKTNNGGINWQIIDDIFSYAQTREILFDSKDRLFANRCYINHYSYSNDYGNTWNSIDLPVDVEFFNTDLVSGSNSNLFYKPGTELYKSNDLGLSWNQFTLPGISDFIGIASEKNIIYLFGKPHSYKSDDGGEQWMQIETPNVNFNPNKIFIHPDGTIFVLRNDLMRRILPEMAYSEDGGQHWTNLKLNLFQIHSIAMSPEGIFYLSGLTLLSGHDTLYASYDKLSTLTAIKPNGYYRSLLADNDILYASVQSTCEKSSDGGINWEPFDTGLPTDKFATSMTKSRQGHLYIAFDDDVVYKTVNTITSTIDSKKNKSISKIDFHPNPVESEIRISILNKDMFQGHYKIIDLHGAEKLKGEFHSNNFTVDCSSLPNGMAFIQIFGKDKLYKTEKIVIAH
jgi:hypothetical protein